MGVLQVTRFCLDFCYVFDYHGQGFFTEKFLKKSGCFAWCFDKKY